MLATAPDADAYRGAGRAKDRVFDIVLLNGKKEETSGERSAGVGSKRSRVASRRRVQGKRDGYHCPRLGGHVVDMQDLVVLLEEVGALSGAAVDKLSHKDAPLVRALAVASGAHVLGGLWREPQAEPSDYNRIVVAHDGGSLLLGSAERLTPLPAGGRTQRRIGTWRNGVVASVAWPLWRTPGAFGAEDRYRCRDHASTPRRNEHPAVLQCGVAW